MYASLCFLLTLTPQLFGGKTADEDVYAIRCLALSSPDRMQAVPRLAEALKSAPGVNPSLVQVIHTEEVSILYYGRYTREVDRSERERYKPDVLGDLEKIRKLSTLMRDVAGREQPVWPFIGATVEALPRVSPHPQWDLESADGHWSYHVAVFYNEGTMRQRKTAAEAYCAQLRAEGHEAFYHHGAVRSSVCVGTFPKEAIQPFETRDRATGRITTVNKIVDPRMLELEKQFPLNLENGRPMHRIVRDAGGKEMDRIPQRSFPVLMPKAERAAQPFGG